MSSKYSDLVLRNRYFLIVDILIFGLSGVLSFIIRLEATDLRPLMAVPLFLLLAVPVKLIVFYWSGMYRQYWSNAGSNELLVVAQACGSAGLLLCVLALFLPLSWDSGRLNIPRSIPLVDALVTSILVLFSRFLIRGSHTLSSRRNHRQLTNHQSAKRTLIIGAGSTGIRVLEAMDNAASIKVAVGFLDDDPHKVGQFVRGLRVLGTTDKLQAVIKTHHIKLVIIAVPSAPQLVRETVEVCQETGVEYRVMPGAYELVSGKISVNALRPVAIDDLLHRPRIELNLDDIQQMIQGRRVLVTGAGGSIGCELSRQIAQYHPATLLLLGHGENSLFATEAKLQAEFPGLRYQLLLADIRDHERMETVFAAWQPELVFHAAAHKHVPMLEANVLEAVSNNVIGTRNIVELCNRYQAQRMVMISTDKAVKPTSVMGMSKRAAELVMLQAATAQPGRFAVVRFGNVLGSRGSVVPTFQQQIAQGGPVTITSAEMTRFFMSIPEAVLLVLKASRLIKYGSLFVLNMGEPVRIVDLANDLIRLSGSEPGRDVEVQITGVRPGEKLFEELFWDFECHHPIEEGAIFALDPSPDLDDEIAAVGPRYLESLIKAAQVGDESESRILLKKTAFAVTGGLRPASDVVAPEGVAHNFPVRTLAPHSNGNGHGGPTHLEEPGV